MAQIFADLVLIPHSAGCLLDGRGSEGLEEKKRKKQMRKRESG